MTLEEQLSFINSLNQHLVPISRQPQLDTGALEAAINALFDTLSQSIDERNQIRLLNYALSGALQVGHFGESNLPLNNATVNRLICERGKQIIVDARQDAEEGQVFMLWGMEFFICPELKILVRTSNGRYVEQESVWYSEAAFDNLYVITISEELVRRDEARYIEGYGFITLDEYNDGEYSYCRHCSTYYLDEAGSFDGRTDEFICDSCRERLERRSSVIQGYSARVDTSPYGIMPSHSRTTGGRGYYGLPAIDRTRRTRYTATGLTVRPPRQKSSPALRFAGVELEVEAGAKRQSMAREVHNLTSDFSIIKSDGSLREGFEIVSRPMTLATHSQVWNDFFANRPRGLRSFDTTTCGMHVHIGREGLSNAQIARIAHFVCLPENDRFIRTIAARKSEQWAEKHHKKLREWNREAGRNTDDRYVALNLTNESTIEFRIFKGTLKRASFLKNIEFCFALAEWCADGSRAAVDYHNAELFTAWVAEAPQRRMYPNLNVFLQGRWPESKVYGVAGQRHFTRTAIEPKGNDKQKPLPITVELDGHRPFEEDSEDNLPDVTPLTSGSCFWTPDDDGDDDDDDSADDDYWVDDDTDDDDCLDVEPDYIPVMSWA